MSEDDGAPVEWKPDAASAARTAAALAVIDARQQRAPVCGLCGQRCRRLDAWGMCSKTSAPHLDIRSRYPR